MTLLTPPGLSVVARSITRSMKSRVTDLMQTSVLSYSVPSRLQMCLVICSDYQFATHRLGLSSVTDPYWVTTATLVLPRSSPASSVN